MFLVFDINSINFNNIKVKNYKFLLKFFVGALTGFTFIPCNHAEMCRKLKHSGDAELFQCPRIFEQKTKSWCCGLNTLDSYCCEWSERAKEANLSMGVLQDSFKYAVFFLTLIGFVALFIWMLCYFASKQKLSILHQRQLDSPSGFANHHHPDALPFAPVPPYTEYSSGFSEQQSYTDQPPPYDQAINGHYGNRDGNATAPVTMPLLSTKVKNGNDLKHEINSTNNEPHLLSLAMPVTVDTAIVTTVKQTSINKCTASSNQPPFNPSYT